MNNILKMYNNITKLIQQGLNQEIGLEELNSSITGEVNRCSKASDHSYPLASAYELLEGNKGVHRENILLSLKSAIIQYSITKGSSGTSQVNILLSRPIAKFILNTSVEYNTKDMMNFAEELTACTLLPNVKLTDTLWAIILIGVFNYQEGIGNTLDMDNARREYIRLRNIKFKDTQDSIGKEGLAMLTEVLQDKGPIKLMALYKQLNMSFYEQVYSYKKTESI